MSCSQSPAWATAMATPLPSLQPTLPVARRVAPGGLEAELPAPGSNGDGGSPATPLVGCCLLLLDGRDINSKGLEACCLVFFLNMKSVEKHLSKKTKKSGVSEKC